MGRVWLCLAMLGVAIAVGAATPHKLRPLPVW